MTTNSKIAPLPQPDRRALSFPKCGLQKERTCLDLAGRISEDTCSTPEPHPLLDPQATPLALSSLKQRSDRLGWRPISNTKGHSPAWVLFATHHQGVQVGTCSPTVQPVASQIIPRGLCPICLQWSMPCVCHMVQSVPVWKVLPELLLRHLALCHRASWGASWPQPLQISLWRLKINSGSDRLQDIKSEPSSST